MVHRGWSDSKLGDQLRKEFVNKIKSEEKNGGDYPRYVELFYSDDNGEAEILNHN